MKLSFNGQGEFLKANLFSLSNLKYSIKYSDKGNVTVLVDQNI